MSDDENPVYLLSIGEPLYERELNDLSDALGDVFDECGIDGEVLLINREVDAIDKDELIEAIES